METTMTTKLPRIDGVTIAPPTSLVVEWSDGGLDTIDLAGWIATGDDLLAPLRDYAMFATARPGLYGASVVWGDEEGDLVIDAHHLRLLAAEQKPFGSKDAAAWQGEIGLSNNEAADFLGISLSTWNAYKAGAPIPTPIVMVCRAARRDPLLLQAHLRPRRPGRPRRMEGSVR
jgi:hypothetical protein